MSPDNGDLPQLAISPLPPFSPPQRRCHSTWAPPLLLQCAVAASPGTPTRPGSAPAATAPPFVVGLSRPVRPRSTPPPTPSSPWSPRRRPRLHTGRLPAPRSGAAVCHQICCRPPPLHHQAAPWCSPLVPSSPRLLLAAPSSVPVSLAPPGHGATRPVSLGPAAPSPPLHGGPPRVAVDSGRRCRLGFGFPLPHILIFGSFIA